MPGRPRRDGADDYAPAVARAAALIDGADNSALAAAVDQVGALAERGRYESAARLRDHTAAAVEALWRGQRLRALAAVDELVAAQPDGAGGWHLAVMRHGQLAAAGTAPARGAADAGRRRAAVPARRRSCAEPAPLGGALVEETALIARWLATPGTRIVRARRQVGHLAAGRRPGRSARVGRDQRPSRTVRPAEQADRDGTQSCWVNRTQRASSCSAAPESIASAARASPSSHDGSHSALAG